MPVIRVASLDDALLALKAEYDENVCRAALRLTESLALADRIRAIEEPEAEKRKAATQAKKGEGKVGAGNLPAPTTRGDTRDKVAAAIGVSGRTLDKMTAIDRAAKAEPEKYGDLPARMDAESVDAAHKERETPRDHSPGRRR